MGFSNAIRKKALVASARRCCVCHRYKGVKVEVHHIIPREEGGSDEFENAIVLCFDCHADVGHYNPKHPRGNSFSQTELRAHRDQWYQAVRENSITPTEHEDLLYCRYLVCKSCMAIYEIGEFNLENIPVQQPLLVENHILRFVTGILGMYGRAYRCDEIIGEHFSTHEEYLEARKDDSSLTTSDPAKLPYFSASRIPNVEEIQRVVCPEDPISALLIKEGNDPAEFCNVLVYEGGCGEPDLFQELFRLRPLWFALLATTNITDKPVTLESVDCTCTLPDGMHLRPFQEPVESDSNSERLPSAPIPPGGTVLIPVASILAPIGYGKIPEWRSEHKQVVKHEWVTTTHTSLGSLLPEMKMIGPALFPKAVYVVADQDRSYQPVHTLDLENLYLIDRQWAVGSCPFVFFRSAHTGTLRFSGHLFGNRPRVPQDQVLVIPPEVNELIFAELEEEVTQILEVRVNGRRVESNITLAKGQSFSLRVRQGDKVEVTGAYYPLHPARSIQPSPMKKNEEIVGFFAEAT
jgi:hypothetical protein